MKKQSSTVRYFHFPKGGALYKEEDGKLFYYDWVYDCVWKDEKGWTMDQLLEYPDDDNKHGVLLTEGEVMLLLL